MAPVKSPTQRPRCLMRQSSWLLLIVVVIMATSGDAFSTQRLTIRTGTDLRAENVDKGFNLLEIASKVVPQGRIVQTAKESWKFVWKRMMTELAPQDKTGSYQRPNYSFGGTIGSAQFPVEAGRYQLYVGNPCPWCHRVRLVVQILGLQQDNTIGMTVLQDDPIKASRGGWVFESPADSKFAVNDLRELYEVLSPGFQGRCTAPLLVDLKGKKIVSNESSDIVRMLPQLVKVSKSPSTLDLCPPSLVSTIDESNEWVYRLLNNGVYRCGFSTTQQAYDKASSDVRQGLQQCQEILSKQPFLCGDTLTESDCLLLPTMLRFDGVYSPLFKAGGSHLRLQCDYPAIHAWLKRCWAIPGVASSIDLADATGSYYKQLFPLNPGGIIPSTVTARGLGLED